jgi:KDO2-lipid IV(A) lauroyltransferase
MVLRYFVLLLQNLSPISSSNFGARIARIIGPLLPATRTADDNLRHALPALSASERHRIIRAVWDNLGRNIAEMPHMPALKRTDFGPGWELHGEKHIENIRAAGTQAIFFSGHFGNWEMILPIAAQLGVAVSGFYRAASNTHANAVIQTLRKNAIGSQSFLFPKGAHGARSALSHLKKGGSLGFLADQKMNDGISVPFLERSAMTAPGIAQLALRFGELPALAGAGTDKFAFKFGQAAQDSKH